MILSVLYTQNQNKDFTNIANIVKKNVNKYELRRFSDKNETIEAVFFIEAMKENPVNKISNDLKALDKSISVDFLDNSNIF